MNVRICMFGGALLIACVVMPATHSNANQVVSLDGSWMLGIDPDNAGVDGNLVDHSPSGRETHSGAVDYSGRVSRLSRSRVVLEGI